MNNSTLQLFFFFQAEDGIRDYKVTGVQTCALPIWLLEPGQRGRLGGFGVGRGGSVSAPPSSNVIGRASCREGVGIAEVAVSLRVKGGRLHDGKSHGYVEGSRVVARHSVDADDSVGK